jgi:E1A/CREB-binding protein
MQRIKRHSTYFTDKTKQNHWCDDCYAVINPEERLVLDDGNEVLKKELQEFKNDALPEEGWVNCDVCQSWVHQICALFNGRTNRSSATYTCPNCCLRMAESGDLTLPSRRNLNGAEHLPESNLSRAIEKGLADALKVAYESRAKDLGVSVSEVERAEGLSVRVLSNVEKKHFVGDEVRLHEVDVESTVSFCRSDMLPPSS